MIELLTGNILWIITALGVLLIIWGIALLAWPHLRGIGERCQHDWHIYGKVRMKGASYEELYSTSCQTRKRVEHWLGREGSVSGKGEG